MSSRPEQKCVLKGIKSIHVISHTVQGMNYTRRLSCFCNACNNQDFVHCMNLKVAGEPHPAITQMRGSKAIENKGKNTISKNKIKSLN